MGGDYSRTSFDALRDFAGVFLQQGHPTLDSDWNELVAIFERRMRAETVDTIGRAVVPRETPNGFEIQVTASPVLRIGRGRMYVHGLLAENHGRIGAGAAPLFDRSRLDGGEAVGVLDEFISTAANDFIDYTAQPYLPVAPPLPAGAGPHLAYLDVWKREVTPLKDPRLLEPALGGIDTATRWQTVWQVRVLPNIGTGASCGSDIAAWDALIAPSPARLTNATIVFEDPDDPCLIPPGGGYRGLENQLYRVEIHSGGALGVARFKWSRENGSVGATIEQFEPGNRVRVRRIGRDSILRFTTGDWVEFTDDRREFAGLSGDMRRVEVDEDSNTLTLETPLSADLIPGNVGNDTAAARHSRAVKWDQAGEVQRADGTPLVDLDDAGSDGLIPVPAGGQAVVLEAGITVSFGVSPAGGALRAMDHWSFAARTEGAQIEPLTNAPPHGVHHHHARLAVVSFPNAVTDCRVFWPPVIADGEECGCTICVSDEGHNSGALTIQAAINQLPAEGGTVCLGPGDYLLGATPVTIANRASVRLRGHGPGTALAYTGQGGAIRVTQGRNVRIDDLAIFVAGPGSGPHSAGVHVRSSIGVTVERTAILVVDFERKRDLGIALDGLLLNLKIDDNLIVAPVGIGGLPREDGEEGGPGFAALIELAITDNLVFASRTGVSLDGLVLHLGPTRIDSNLVVAGETGVVTTGVGFPTEGGWSASAVSVTGNSLFVSANGSGVVSGTSDLRIHDNEISMAQGDRSPTPGSCIRLVDGIIALPRPDGQITGNRIGNCNGHGILIEAPQTHVLIKQNVIRDCAMGGFAMGPNGSAQTLSFDNNVIANVGFAKLALGNALAPLSAIRLGAVVEARIIGNTIRGVGAGSESAAYWAGMDLRGVARLDCAHNMISAIGPASANNRVSRAIGILIDGPFLTCALTANQIFEDRAPNPNDGSSWAGIAIDSRIEFTASRGSGRAFVVNGLSALPAFAVRGEEVVALSARSLAAFVPAREGQLRIGGNQIADTHQNSDLPLVLVATDEKSGSLSFADNQCKLEGPGRAKAIVDLTAPRLAVSNNVVRRNSELDAMHLTCMGSKDAPLATVIGNLTFGKILLNGNELPAAFKPLNIISG